MAVFYIDNAAQPTLNMVKGNIYRFDQGNASNSAAPLLLSETEDGENAGGVTYNTGVSYWLGGLEQAKASYVGSAFVNATSRFMQIEVAVDAPAVLYYYAFGTPGMGGSVTITA